MEKKLSEYNNIYIACPPHSRTGGPELLHQLCKILQCYGLNAHIVYYGLEDKTYDIIEDYKQYIDNYCLESEILDLRENLLIVPEVRVEKLRRYKMIDRAIWWLSVDNFFLTHMSLKSFYYLKKQVTFRMFLVRIKGCLINVLKKRAVFLDENDKLFKTVGYNFCQSKYAMEFCKKNNYKKVISLSDYIDTVFNEKSSLETRENIVIYNPKKGFKITKKIIKLCPEVKFVPLINLSRQQLHELMQRAKIYIDFGTFPGKDRMPREACLSGCVVITGREGAAQFYEDVPLPDTYKFSIKNKCDLMDVRKLILSIFEDYDKFVKDIDSYKQIILNEKNCFEDEVLQLL